ncbi:MAG TPA: glycolate oxidase subunit GlcF [Rhizomicrobium sp.]|nr:glycolate oxidase subunit GlcF [Rhizomicrobium sp.]
MRTAFSPAQLADPVLAEAERNLRACVHCGICTATCPTYVLLGDERDGPRGRIVMMQAMLEADATPSRETVTHVDRCLSCLACRSACPSGVDYARLADAARAHIEARYARPPGERATRWLVARILPRPGLARAAVALARFFAPLATRLPGSLGALARTAAKAGAPGATCVTDAANAAPARRVALMPGCVEPALEPAIGAAATRVLARRGIGTEALAGCCGALAHHLGRRVDARAAARRVIAAFETMAQAEAVTIAATGCAAHLMEYPHLFAGDPEWAPRARAFAAKVRDFATLAATARAPANAAPRGPRIAWAAPCSMQNGTRTAGEGRALLEAAGYAVADVPEAHFCCGSAGSYSLLQPGIATALRARKLANAAATAPAAIATANIGCLIHLRGPDAPPVVHLAELIDWSEGGPRPRAMG